MKILVCGSRVWTNRAAIERELRKLGSGLVVVHGAHWQGADAMVDVRRNSCGEFRIMNETTIKNSEWIQYVLTQEAERVQKQSLALDGSGKARVVPGGFVCSMRMGKVER